MKRLSEKRRLLVGMGALAALALYAYVLYLLQPLARAVIHLSQQVREVSRQVQQIEQVVAQATNVQQEYSSLETRVAQLRDQLPSENELPTVIEWISELASQTGVKILSIFPQRAAQPLEPDAQLSPGLYKAVAIEIDALSGFHQLGMFLSRVESGDQSVEVKQLRVSHSERELRRHNVKLILLTYVTITDGTET